MAPPRYPVSRNVRKTRAADLSRDLERALHAIESGIGQIFDNAEALRCVDTDGYNQSALHVFVTGVGLFQWDPTSVALDDGVNAIQPKLGPSASGPGRWVPASSGGGPGTVSVYDEGVLVRAGVSEIDFVGADVLALGPGGLPSRVRVYIPPPAFLSHWNTADGTNGPQFVTESISRTTTHISTPVGGEGTPFRTGGWAGSNQDTTRSNTVTLTTAAPTTGWGGDSTMTVTVMDADGVTPLEAYTTPPITANATHVAPTGRITVAVTGFAVDSIRYQARVTITVNVLSILSTAGRQGGRYNVVATQTTDSSTDGSGPYTYTQTAVFLDTDPFTPSLTGLTIAETAGFVTTKHLSGVEYYTLGSRFTVAISDIDYLNANTARTVGNVEIAGPEYGLPALSQSPFGVGAANFAGWTNNNDNTNASYNKTDWAITAASYRLMSPTASIDAYPRDPWASGALVASANANVLIDTYAANSTALAEYFNDETYREDPASFPGDGTCDSTSTLVAGQAQVWNGQLVTPNTTTYVRPDGAATPNANWSGFDPDLGGPNPDYSGLGAPVNYGRRFTQPPGNIPSFAMTFTGTFAAGNALADLVAGNLEIFVYRIGGFGHVGPPPGNTFPLRVHLPFNFASWNDGTTVPGSGIREGSSAGNAINCTLGAGTPANGGLYVHIRILNSATRLDSLVV